MKTKSNTHVEYQAFRALWKSSIIATLFATSEGRVLAASPAACRLFGRTEDDIRRIGRKGILDLTDKRSSALFKTRENKGYAQGELTFVRSDGTRFPALLSSFSFETPDGIQNCSLIRDISKLKQAEERVHLFSRELLSVREEEKRQLSAVLHHEVGSISVGLGARLLSIEEDLREGKCREALHTVRSCRRMFTQAGKRLRALAVDLRPPDLDLLGLPAALRQRVREVSSVSSVNIAFTDASRGAKISGEAQTVLFRAAQESLNNVLEHAGARSVRVRLSSTQRKICLTIVDDGRGFEPGRLATRPGRHLGLEAMREMASSLGGEVVVQSARGRGTTIRVDLPRVEPEA